METARQGGMTTAEALPSDALSLLRRSSTDQPHHYCAEVDVAIPLPRCWEHTKRQETNEKFCMPSCCSSELRACTSCVKHGTVSHASLLADRKSGLCSFHVRCGATAIRIRPLDPAQGMKSDIDIARIIRRKSKKEGLTLEEIAEEIDRPLAWVKEVLSRLTEHIERQPVRETRERADVGVREVVVSHESVQPAGMNERRSAMPRGKRLSDEVVEQILELVKSGKDDDAIASRLKLNVGTVMRYRRKSGKLLRQKRGAKPGESKGASTPAAGDPKRSILSRVPSRISGGAARGDATSMATESMAERIKQANEYFRLGHEIMESVRAEHAKNQALIAKAGKGETEGSRHPSNRKR